MTYDIRWSPDARDHLRGLAAYRRVTVVEGVEKQLTSQPDQPTQKRKLLRESPLATWELRLGNTRVFYNINERERAVEIVAIGIKEHNRLRIGGEEVQL